VRGGSSSQKFSPTRQGLSYAEKLKAKPEERTATSGFKQGKESEKNTSMRPRIETKKREKLFSAILNETQPLGKGAFRRQNTTAAKYTL